MTLYTIKTKRDPQTMELGDTFDFAMRSFAVVGQHRDKFLQAKFLQAQDQKGNLMWFQVSKLPNSEPVREFLKNGSTIPCFNLLDLTEFDTPQFATSHRTLSRKEARDRGIKLSDA